MNDLTHELLQLTRHNKDGSYATQKNRQSGLLAMASQLHELGYKLQSASALKPKHVQALVETWQDTDLAQATIRNRLSWLRWWAAKINKAPTLARTNKAYGANQHSTGKLNRAQAFDLEKFDQLECEYVKASLFLQLAFGLRREEAIKFDPKYAIRYGRIRFDLRPNFPPLLSRVHRFVLTLCGQFLQVHFLCIFIGREIAQG